MVVYGGASGVPMAVPFNCLNVMSPKEKMLFSITSFRAAISALFCFGRSSGTDLWMCLAISMIVVFVGMFVCIEIALAVKSFVFGGYVVESIVLDGVHSYYKNRILVVWPGFAIFSQSRYPGDVVGSQGKRRLVNSSNV